MEQLQNNYETQACDSISVFSFCADTRTQQSNKHSIATARTQEYVDSAAEPQGTPTLPEDVLSMIDFFVGASDYDAQTSNADSSQPQAHSGHISEGVDLLQLKLSRNLVNLRKHKINKLCSKMSRVKVASERKAGVASAFLGLERAVGRFSGENFVHWFRK